MYSWRSRNLHKSGDIEAARGKTRLNNAPKHVAIFTLEYFGPKWLRGSYQHHVNETTTNFLYLVCCNLRRSLKIDGALKTSERVGHGGYSCVYAMTDYLSDRSRVWADAFYGVHSTGLCWSVHLHKAVKFKPFIWLMQHSSLLMQCWGQTWIKKRGKAYRIRQILVSITHKKQIVSVFLFRCYKFRSLTCCRQAICSNA